MHVCNVSFFYVLLQFIVCLKICDGCFLESVMTLPTLVIVLVLVISLKVTVSALSPTVAVLLSFGFDESGKHMDSCFVRFCALQII